MNFTRTIISLVILVVFMMCGCTNTGQQKEKSKGDSIANKTDKQTENGVERASGTEQNGAEKQPGQVKVLSEEEKQTIETNTNNLMRNAQIFIEKKDYENAYKVISEVQKNLAELTGHYVPPQESDAEASNLCLQHPDQAFPKLREEGEAGFDKAVKFFNIVVERLKKNNIKYSEEAIKKFDKAQELRKNGDLKGAFDMLYDAYITLRDSFTPPGTCATTPTGSSDKKGVGSEPQQVDKSKNDTKPSGEGVKKPEDTSGFTSMKKTIREYVNKFGKDKYITDTMKKIGEIQTAARQGKMSNDEADKKLKEIEKEVSKKLK